MEKIGVIEPEPELNGLVETALLRRPRRFTEQGDPVINDPGTTLNVRKTFPRQNLIAAWAFSRNAAYLIYPADAEVPKDRFGHWASWTSRRRIILKR